MTGKIMRRGATFSEDRRYRYLLWRHWDNDVSLVPEETDGERMLIVIGLNPSTADETLDDPTIRRCISFARRWGCSGLRMLNLFAYRATNPGHMMAEPHPTGDDNDWFIRSTLGERHGTSDPVVLCAWGAHGDFMERDREMMRIMREFEHIRPLCLGQTRNHSPRHPLYMPADTEPVEYFGRPEITLDEMVME